MPRKRGRTTIRVAGRAVADDLVERDFAPAGAEPALGRRHHLPPTWQGWLYLAAVSTLSRRVVGWSMADHLRAELVVDALDMALARRRPAPGLVHHSDQGCAVHLAAFGQRCREAGIARSMGSDGDCYDNAVAESFFATLKKELVHRRSWPTRREPGTAVFDYIEAFYNRDAATPRSATSPRLSMSGPDNAITIKINDETT